MNPKIVFLDSSTLGGVDNLSQVKNLGEYAEYPVTKAEETIERIADAEIVICNKVIIGKEVINASPSLKLICIAATGMNNVDLDYAKVKGIQVKNVAGYSTESVAQSTFSMLFHLLHQNRYYDDYVKTGEYCNSSIFTHYGSSFWELKGKNYGIVGLGNIGKRVAEIATVFGTEVYYYSTSGNNLNTAYKHLSLDELLSTCDIVSIHCPLNSRTENLINESKLKLMKSGAYLLNMGRGGIVNESALAKAIDQQWIAGTCIDVLTAEPIKQDNPLLEIERKENIFITPHTAWASIEARRLLVEKLAANISEYLKHL